jgi:hypothetical protein
MFKWNAVVNIATIVRFQALAGASMMIIAFWVIMPYSLVEVD